jgi:Cu(I)/Ag(I) efflux system membrane fusion protein
VLDSGTRQIVIVRDGEASFQPRIVQLGQRGDGYVEVLSGIRAGENVVVGANFLIDAESNLRAALRGMIGNTSPAGKAVPADSANHLHDHSMPSPNGHGGH